MFLLLVGCARPPGAEVEPVPPTCATGFVADGGTCVPEQCGVGTWGGVAVDADTLYVRAGGTGDGTPAQPLGSIQTAVNLAGARGGGRVVVAAGTYLETIAMGDGHTGVEILGRCADLVTLDGTEGDGAPALTVLGRETRPELRVEGLTLSRGAAGVSLGHATVALTDVTIQDNAFAGILVADAALSMTRVGVLRTVPFASGHAVWGLSAYAAASVDATDSTLQGNAGAGILVSGAGTAARLVRTAVLDTVPTPDGGGGRGVEAGDGATLSATGCIIQNNTDIGVYAGGAETVVDLVDTAVLDTRPAPDGRGGRGIEVEEGATLSALGGSVERSHEAGVGVLHAGTRVSLDQTRILDTAPGPQGNFGQGISAQEGAAVTVTGAFVHGNSGASVFGSDDATRVVFVDTEIRDTVPDASDDLAWGIYVTSGASMRASGCAVHGCTGIGVIAHDLGTTVELADTVVTDTHRSRSMGFALGLLAQDDARVDTLRGAVTGTEGPGAYVVGGTMNLVGTDLSSNTFAGVMLLAGTLTLDGVSIADTRADAEWGGGIGVYVRDQVAAGTLRITDSSIGPHPYAAVWLDGNGAYLIEDSLLTGSDGIDADGHPIHGNAVFAERGVSRWDGASGLRIARTTMVGATEVAVLLDGAAAALEANSWSGNGTDVWQQRCDQTIPLDDADLVGVPTWERCPDANLLTASALAFTTLYLPEVTPE